MGKYDLAIRLGKSLLSDTASYVKACGKRSILETKPTIFHGINPTATYPLSGKTFALPRFCTHEMQEARRMNKIAIRQAKSQGINRTYPKASPQDLKRLTSETIEDSYSRVEWTNPKDGKVYNLLKQGETKDGKVVVRILDEQGAFVKEAELMPKNIVIVDDIAQIENLAFSDSFGLNSAHGNSVTQFIKRNNPFSHYDVINNSDNSFLAKFFLPEDKLEFAIKELIERIEKGQKVDYINFSWGCEKPIDEFLQKYGEKFFKLEKFKQHSTLKSEMLKERNLFVLLDKLNKLSKEKGIRILNASGNGGKSSQGLELFFDNIEGVGSLNNKGKISEFSASRSSKFTQHYELGEFEITSSPCGINFTGISGTDIPIMHKYQGTSFLGKKINDVIIPDKLYDNLLTAYKNFKKNRHMFHKEWSKLFGEYKQKYLFSVEQAEKIGFSNGQVKSGFIHIQRGFVFSTDKNGKLIPFIPNKDYSGTSFSTPIRTAKLALNDMMKDVL